MISQTSIQVTAKVGTTKTPVKLTGLAISPHSLTLHKHTMQHLTVTAIFSNHTRKTITTGVAFKSTNPKIVAVTNRGLVHAIAAGKASVIVTYRGISAKVMITIH